MIFCLFLRKKKTNKHIPKTCVSPEFTKILIARLFKAFCRCLLICKTLCHGNLITCHGNLLGLSTYRNSNRVSSDEKKRDNIKCTRLVSTLNAKIIKTTTVLVLTFFLSKAPRMTELVRD